jgi:hypothetical protein
VGLLELFAGHGQNRFYRELEEWLSTITRVGFSSGEEGSTDTGVMAGVIDQMAEQMEALQHVLSQSEASRAEMDHKLAGLIATQTARQEQESGIGAALDRVARGQDALIETLREHGMGDGIDAESRMRLRSIDVQMLRILEEISAGRQESLAELRKDIELLIRALDRPRSGTGSEV